MRPTSVQDVMTRDVAVVGEDTRVKELARLMYERRISGVPVVDGKRHLVGIVSEADLLRTEERREAPGRPLMRWLVHPGSTTEAWGRTQDLRARDVMTREVITAAPDTPAVEAVRTLLRAGVKRLPVVDAQGRVVGIVSRHDLLKPLLREDEAIRSEIADEIVAGVMLINPSSVTVSVEDGVVSLQGHVERRSEKNALRELARRVNGVVGVIDELSFEYEDGPSRRDETRGFAEARTRGQERALRRR